MTTMCFIIGLILAAIVGMKAHKKCKKATRLDAAVEEATKLGNDKEAEAAAAASDTESNRATPTT